MSSASTVDLQQQQQPIMNTNSNVVASVAQPSDAELIEALRQTLSQKLNETGEEKR